MGRVGVLGALLLAELLAASCTAGPIPGLPDDAGAGFSSRFGPARYGWFLPEAPLEPAPLHLATAPTLECECESLGECEAAACDGAMCDPQALDDDSPCGMTGEDICIAGTCTAIEVCSTEEASLPFVVASHAFGEEWSAGPSPSAGVDGAGRVLVVWTAVEDPEVVLYARRFAADGAPIECSDAPIELTRDEARGWDLEPAVVGLDSGWVVTWTSPWGDGDVGGIAYRRVSAGGRLPAPARQANRQPFFHQHAPAVAALDGGFVIAWTDEAGLDPADELLGVKARRFDAAGAALDEVELTVPASTGADQLQPAVAAIGSTWLVAWTHTPLGFDSSGVATEWAPTLRARRFSGATPLDDDDLVLAEDFAVGASATALLDDETFAVAWESRATDGYGDVLARTVPAGEGMLGSPSNVAVDGDTAELGPSIAPLGEGYVTAVELGESPRDVSLVAVGDSLPGGAAELQALLSGDSFQRHASVLATADALWVVWSDDATQWGDSPTITGDPDAYRSVLVYRLELGGGP